MSVTIYEAYGNPSSIRYLPNHKPPPRHDVKYPAIVVMDQAYILVVDVLSAIRKFQSEREIRQCLYRFDRYRNCAGLPFVPRLFRVPAWVQPGANLGPISVAKGFLPLFYALFCAAKLLKLRN
jgi:hypothetical protein